MKNFVPAVNWPLVIFCDAASQDFIKQLRGGKPAAVVATCLDEFCVWPQREILRAQCREKHPGLPADFALVMNEKPNFLRRAMAMNAFDSEMFFWCDIGVFRPARLCGEGELFCLSERMEWPNLRVCRRACANQVALVGIKHRPPSNRPLGDAWILGGFFGGPAAPLRAFCDAFYDCFRRRIQHGDFAHSEEAILRDACAAHPTLARLVMAQTVPWLRWLNIRRPPAAWWWYFLSGERFPWNYFRREIGLRQVFSSLWRGALRKIRRGGIWRPRPSGGA